MKNISIPKWEFVFHYWKISYYICTTLYCFKYIKYFLSPLFNEFKNCTEIANIFRVLNYFTKVMKSIFLILSMVFLCHILNGQDISIINSNFAEVEQPKNCGHHHLSDNLNNEERAVQEERKSLISDYLQKYIENLPADYKAGAPINIPVAVHFQNYSNPDHTCLKNLAVDQIDRLNKDFQGINIDVGNWEVAKVYYPNVDRGMSGLNFCIAKYNHPAGFGLNNGDLAITINQTNGDFVTKWAGYLNIYVRHISDTVAGYSYVGGYGNGDGVTVDDNYFGSFSCSGVNVNGVNKLGRTLTHEIGHYLFLNHIWGPEDGCDQDDGITDTPNAQEPNEFCPQLGNTSSCGTQDLFMNYMDYAADPCMYMFTNGQVTLMEAFVNTYLTGLKSNFDNVCNAPSGLTLNVKTFLQGAYNYSSNLMEDKLRQQNRIPLTNPYRLYATFSHTANESTTQSVLNVSGVNAIVDWVVVELRSSVNSSVVVESKAGLLQRDGDIVDVNGIDPLSFVSPSGSYYVAVRHRNHLGVMTYSPQNIVSNSTIDFSSTVLNCYGNFPTKIDDGKRLMWAGNSNADDELIFQGIGNDANAVFFDVITDPENFTNDQNFIISGYYDSDFNLDGQVIYQGIGNDPNILFFNILTFPTNNLGSSSFIMLEQLP